MRLTRDTAGTYAQGKDSLQRDLVTLQVAFDQQQAETAAQQKQIDDILARIANPNISIAANGQVSGLPGPGIKTVAHDSSLIGFGTPTSPLRVLFPSNTAGAVATTTPFALTNGSITGLGTTYAGGQILVPGVAGMSVEVIAWGVQYTKNAFAWTAAPTFRLLNNSVGNLIASDINPPNAANAGEYGGVGYGAARTWGANVANNDPAGQALVLLTSGVVTPGSVVVSSGVIVVWYVLQPSS